MIELSKTELATALIMGLNAMDTPPNRKWDEPRSAEDRDAARRLSKQILSIVPDMTELAKICVAIWVKERPSVVRDGADYYHGPDIFRGEEIMAGYPDDSGWNEDDDIGPPPWAERAGLHEQNNQFWSAACDEMQRLHQVYKREKADARRRQRAEKQAAKAREERQSRLIAGMLQTATMH